MKKLSCRTWLPRIFHKSSKSKQFTENRDNNPPLKAADTRAAAGRESIQGYEKYTKDTLLVGIAHLLFNLRGLILLPVLTKMLGAELYGVWAQLLATIGLLAPLASLQLNQAMTRFLTAREDKQEIGKGLSSILSVMLVTTAIFSLLMFLLSGDLAKTVFGGLSSAPFIRMAVPLLFVTIIEERFTRHYFRSFRQIKKYSAFMMLQLVAEIGLVSYLVLAGFGLRGVIYAMLAARLVMLIVEAALVLPQIRITTPSLSLIKTYLVFSLPLIPFMLCAWIVGSSDRYVIGYFMDIDAVGIYSVAYNLGNVVNFFIAPIWVVMLPAITSLYENNRMHELRVHLKYSLKLFLALAIPAFVGLAVLARPLLAVLTTDEFVESYLVIPLIALAMVLFGSSTIMGNILVLVKRTKTLALVYGGSAILNLVLNIALVPAIGILGAAVGTLATFAVHLIIMRRIAFRALPFDTDPRFIIKGIVSAAVMGAVVFWLNPSGITGIVIAIIVGVVLYSGILILLKGISREEYRFLTGMIKRSIKS